MYSFLSIAVLRFNSVRFANIFSPAPMASRRISTMSCVPISTKHHLYRCISTSLRPRQQALEEPAVPQQMPNGQLLSYCAHTRQRHNAAGSAGPVSRPEACGSDEPEGNRRVCPASRQYAIRQRCNGWWSTMQVGPAETKPVENGWRTIEM